MLSSFWFEMRDKRLNLRFPVSDEIRLMILNPQLCSYPLYTTDTFSFRLPIRSVRQTHFQLDIAEKRHDCSQSARKRVPRVQTPWQLPKGAILS